MNDEIERLQSALRANRPSPPAECQERALAAALAAFDDHHQTRSKGAVQAEYDNRRRGVWWLFLPVSNWWLRPAFASAITLGLAVVLFVAYLRPFTQLSSLGPGLESGLQEQDWEGEPPDTLSSLTGVFTSAESAPPLGLSAAPSDRAHHGTVLPDKHLGALETRDRASHFNNRGNGALFSGTAQLNQFLVHVHRAWHALHDIPATVVAGVKVPFTGRRYVLGDLSQSRP